MDCMALARCTHTPPGTPPSQPERHENGLHCACALHTPPPGTPRHTALPARTARKWIALRLRVAHTHTRTQEMPPRPGAGEAARGRAPPATSFFVSATPPPTYSAFCDSQ